MTSQNPGDTNSISTVHHEKLFAPLNASPPHTCKIQIAAWPHLGHTISGHTLFALSLRMEQLLVLCERDMQARLASEMLSDDSPDGSSSPKRKRGYSSEYRAGAKRKSTFRSSPSPSQLLSSAGALVRLFALRESESFGQKLPEPPLKRARMPQTKVLHMTLEAPEKDPQEGDLPKTPKLHSCSFCSKSFKQRSNLVAHERIHTGEKPYVCEICDRGFAQLSNKKRHLRVHRNRA